MHFTLPHDPHNAQGSGGKVYGIASIMRSDFRDAAVERVREADWDLEGRIHCVELRQQLAVFNVYAVNGTDSPYRAPRPRAQWSGRGTTASWRSIGCYWKSAGGVRRGAGGWCSRAILMWGGACWMGGRSCGLFRSSM